MAWNDGLTGPALQIAEIDTPRLRVMAGPGTGKSFAMKRRVQRLLEQGADPKRILAVTFTRVAGKALVKELGELGVPGCDEIKAGTLHSYCFSLLTKAEALNFSGRVPRPLFTFSIAGSLQFEASPLIKDIQIPTYGNKRECTKRILAFEAAWARLQSDVAGWPTDSIDASFHDALINWLRFHQGILIGELVPEALKYLRGNPNSPELSAFDHVIVDEYQDLNKADQELIELLSTNAQSLIIGDVDQSIYRFRHAHPEGITDYLNTHTGTHDETLNECRRCPTQVVGLASNLIKHNYPPGTLPRLQPMTGNSNGEVHLVQWQSPIEEVAGIGKFIIHLVEKRGFQPFDILVLTPRRKFGYSLRDYLASQNVPAHSFFKEELLESEEAQKAFCLLTLLVKPDDRVALRFWLGHGNNSLNVSQYKILRQYCESTGFSPKDALSQAIAGTNIGKIGNLITKFQELQTEIGKLSGLSTKEVVEYLFPNGTDWAKAIREASLSKITDDMEVEKLHSILSNILISPDMPEEGEFVRIMSPHGSKGLTSKVVIIMGAVEGLFPFIDESSTPIEQDLDLKEQRRLFYVAITRPTEILTISSFSQIDRSLAHKIGARLQRGGGIGKAIASRFINELGPSAPPSVNGTDWETNTYA